VEVEVHDVDAMSPARAIPGSRSGWPVHVHETAALVQQMAEHRFTESAMTNSSFTTSAER